MESVVADLVAADHLRCNAVHVGVQQNVSLFVPVAIHPQQFPKIINVMYVNTNLASYPKGIACSTTFHKVVGLLIDRFRSLQHRYSTSKSVAHPLTTNYT
jgi:hypothetical protein